LGLIIHNTYHAIFNDKNNYTEQQSSFEDVVGADKRQTFFLSWKEVKSAEIAKGEKL
jgi:hypothetical protein